MLRRIQTRAAVGCALSLPRVSGGAVRTFIPTPIGAFIKQAYEDPKKSAALHETPVAQRYNLLLRWFQALRPNEKSALRILARKYQQSKQRAAAMKAAAASPATPVKTAPPSLTKKTITVVLSKKRHPKALRALRLRRKVKPSSSLGKQAKVKAFSRKARVGKTKALARKALRLGKTKALKSPSKSKPATKGAGHKKRVVAGKQAPKSTAGKPKSLHIPFTLPTVTAKPESVKRAEPTTTKAANAANPRSNAVSVPTQVNPAISTYTEFVQKRFQDPALQKLPLEERLSVIAKLFVQQKKE